MHEPSWRFPVWLAVGGLIALVTPAAAVPVVTMGDLSTPLILDTNTQIDVNNIAMFVTNSGGFARDLQSPGGPAGFFFPRGTDKTAVYAAGLWFGSKVHGDVRVTVAEYSLEYQPGTCHYDAGQGKVVWDNPADPSLKIYKIIRGDTLASDYLNWPPQAPRDSRGRPLTLGDQTLWAVYNDADPTIHNNNAGGSAPQDIEVRQTTFAFDRPAPLGNTIFVKFMIYNRGADTLQDCYASLWSDPDLGGATDDMVGCDTTRSLGFVYNNSNNDEIYGSAPPAVGYDFFQGPIVPSEGDTAHVSGHAVPNYRNLPMTSFNRYINGTDPDSRFASYFTMQGFQRDGSQIINTDTGLPTKFFYSGDPVAGTGFLDPSQADKRLQLSSGPFTMAPGDSQEVVVAIVVAQGADRLSSVSLLKLYDDQAQAVFDANFALASAPPRPTLYVTPLNNELDLTWSANAVGDVQKTEALGEEYHFQGYNLYQSSSIAGPWTKIRTWDIADSVGLIYGDVFDVVKGGNQRVILQNGTNNGLAFHVRLTQDMIRGEPLVNYHPYYFALTTYSYDVNHITPFFIGANKVGYITPTLENSPQGVQMEPKASAAVLETDVTHTVGTNEGAVKVEIVDPSVQTNATYNVVFDYQISGADTVGTVWHLINTTTGDTLLARQTHTTLDPNDYSFAVVNGLMVRAISPRGWRHNDSTGVMVDEIAGADGAAVPPDGLGGPGKSVWQMYNSTGDWAIQAGGGDGGEDRFTRDGDDLANLSSEDIIWKWDDAPDNWAWWLFGDGTWHRVPFGVYARNPATGRERRLVPAINDISANPDAYEWADSAAAGKFANHAGSDWIYAYDFVGDWAALVADVTPDGTLDDPGLNNDITNELFARMELVSSEDLAANAHFPATGTVIQFSTQKASQPGEIFTFRTSAPGAEAGTTVGYDMKSIRAVPNPYLNSSAYELNQFNRVVKFINLPNKPTTIRIFNLAGHLVKSIEKTDPNSSEAIWDLQNEKLIPVASGIYIYQVESKGVGSVVGKMAVFIEKERLNRF